MSKDKGKRAPQWVADYLRHWWPSAEKTPNSRPGRDILGTPGVAFEIKTGVEWRTGSWVKQAAKYPLDGELPVLVYLGPGCGEGGVCDALAVVPLNLLMPVLVAAGFAPAPFRQEAP